MHPIALHSGSLGWLTVDQLAPVAAEIGFAAVELTVLAGGHVEPGRARVDLRRAVRTLRLAGISVPLVATSVEDPDDDRTIAFLAAIAEAGIRRYRLVDAVPPDRDRREAPGPGRDDEPPEPGSGDALRATLERLEDVNARLGLTGCVGYSPDEAEAWRSRLLGSPAVGVVVTGDLSGGDDDGAGTRARAAAPRSLRSALAGYEADVPVVVNPRLPLSGPEAKAAGLAGRAFAGRPGSIPGAPRDPLTRLAAERLRRELEAVRAADR